MKFFLLLVLSMFLLNNNFSVNGVAFATDTLFVQVIPNAYTTTNGNGVFTGPLSTTARTYQWLIHEDQLTALLNKDLVSFNMRIPSSATTPWPAAEVNFANYDIYLSQSVAPQDRSLTFAQNIVGPQTQVRAGPLAFNVNSFPSGGSPNEWGPDVIFDIEYQYSGGHLLVELRHTGFTGTSRTNDAITASGGAPYGTLVSACWTGSYTGVTASQGNFSIIKLNSKNPIPVELNTFTSTVIGNNVSLNWSTATETNNKGFAIERKATDGSFEEIAFVNGFGTTTEVQNYSFVDNNLLSNTYNYRLKQIDFDGSYAYHNLNQEVFVGAPTVFSLSQNFPNPFNPSTLISYQIPVDSKVNITVYDLLGNVIAVLVNEEKAAGSYEIKYDASSLSSGVYFYKLLAGEFVSTKKMNLLK